MTIKQQGGIFGRNPTFNNVTIEGELTFDGDIDINSDLKIDGDLEVTGTSKLTGNVGIGKSSGVQSLEVQGEALFGSGTDGIKLTYSGGNSTGIIDTGYTSTGLEFRVGNVKKVILNSSGNLEMNSGSGIDFSATSGTGTSELFDDYEEGTWTPVLTFGGASVGITYSHQTGLYTKIGNVVKFELRIRISSKGTSTGNAVITGLPFSPSSSLNGYVGRQFLCYTSAITASTAVGIVFDTSTSISLYETPGSSLAALNDTDFTTNSYLTITGSYTAA
jgi:hypothetical protein